MNSLTQDQVEKIINFMFSNGCKNWGDAYITALDLLKEKPVIGWKTNNVIEAILRITQ